MLYFTYVVRPGESPEGRGPLLEPGWEKFLNFSLRTGLTLQLLSLLGMILSVGLGSGLSLQQLEFMKLSKSNIGNTPVGLLVILTFVGIAALLSQLSYLDVLDDDSSIKQTRGFRAGTKLLYQALVIAILAYSFRNISTFAANRYFRDLWIEEQVGSNANRIMYMISLILEAVYLYLMSSGLFMLEAYHSEGVGEQFGWGLLFFFRLASIFEFLFLLFGSCEYCYIFDMGYTLSLLVGLSLATVWSFYFEPLSHLYDVKMTQSALRSEFYKSKNAMAYYGPAVVNNEGEIDLNAAADQARSAFESRA